MPRKRKLPRGISEKKPGVYWIQYFDAEGRRHREKAGSFSTATSLLAIRHTEKLTGKLPPPKKKAMVLFRDLSADALVHARSENDPVHVHELELKFKTLGLDFATRPAESITRQEIVKWLDEKEAERSWKPATYNVWKAAISLIFRVGQQNDRIARNPIAKVRRKHADNGRVRYLTSDEEKALTKVLLRDWPQYYPIFIMSLHTGMRMSEQFRGVVGDYDPISKNLTVHQKKDRNKSKVRYVPMTPMAIEAYMVLAKGKPLGAFLCTNHLKEVMGETRYWFDPAVTVAKISNYHWHDNRHTACSRWVMSGVPIARVAKYAGHSTIQMTMRYTHLIPDEANRDVEKMMSFYDQPKVDVKARKPVRSATRTATGASKRSEKDVSA